MPDDHPLAVFGIERDLLSFREAGHSGLCIQSLREIHQRALRHIHQRDESDERGSGYNEPFEQRHGSFNSMGTGASNYWGWRMTILAYSRTQVSAAKSATPDSKMVMTVRDERHGLEGSRLCAV